MASADKTDLWFTPDGDYWIDETGDLKDTTRLYGRSLIQEVRSRLSANRGDWILHPLLAANLEEQLGEPGTSKTIISIVNAIIKALTFDNLVLPNELEIYPLPISSEHVIFRIIIHTPKGELTEIMSYNSDTLRFVGN